jgi:hypothetical protein
MSAKMGEQYDCFMGAGGEIILHMEKRPFYWESNISGQENIGRSFSIAKNLILIHMYFSCCGRNVIEVRGLALRV